MSLLTSIFRKNQTVFYNLATLACGGPVQGWQIAEGQGQIYGPSVMNTILYSGADLLGKILGGQSAYRVNAMYFEFIKGSGSFSAPAITRAGGDYYSLLRLNNGASSDFLRIPLDITPQWASTDQVNFATNQVRFFAQSSDGVGARSLAHPGHGLSFTTGDTIVGGALVATPTANTEDDVVFSRFYFAGGNRLTKSASQQIGITWPIQFN